MFFYQSIHSTNVSRRYMHNWYKFHWFLLWNWMRFSKKIHMNEYIDYLYEFENSTCWCGDCNWVWSRKNCFISGDSTETSLYEQKSGMGKRERNGELQTLASINYYGRKQIKGKSVTWGQITDLFFASFSFLFSPVQDVIRIRSNMIWRTNVKQKHRWMTY